MDQLLQYATSRIIELERLLLMDVPETVWHAEVRLVYAQVERAGALPAHHQCRLKYQVGSVRASSNVPPFLGMT